MSHCLEYHVNVMFIQKVCHFCNSFHFMHSVKILFRPRGSMVLHAAKVPIYIYMLGTRSWPNRAKYA
jgi:hypothetical protein